MLLALIVMATITLGLLFSGWLTPAPGRAQQGGGGGGSNDESTNCPNYTYTTNVSCPSITNAMSLSPMTFCVKLGDDLPDPGWTAPGPGATPGSVVITTTETCSNVVSFSTNNVTYSFSWHYDAPGKPPKPTAAGTVTSPICWGVVTSSDTNDCAPPADVNLGTVTWNVIDPDPQSPVTTVDVKSIVDTYYKGPAAAIAELENIVPSCNFDPPSPTGTITYTTPQVCCGNTVASTKKIKGSVGLKITDFSCAVPGLGYEYKDWFYVGITGHASGSVTVSVSYQYDPCGNNQPIVCCSGDAEGTLGFSAGIVSNLKCCTIDFSGSVNASGSLSMEACTGQPVNGTFKINPLTLSGTCAVTTTFFKCEFHTPSIDLSPSITIPIHADPISL